MEHTPPPYAELQVTSHYSFLRAGSHPEELVATAAHLGYRAIGICDWMTLGGVVRAHTAAKQHQIPLLIGCALPLFGDDPQDPLRADPFPPHALVYPTSKGGYEELSLFLSSVHQGKVSPDERGVFIAPLISSSPDLIVIIPYPCSHLKRVQDVICSIKEALRDRFFLGICRYFTSRDDELLEEARRLSQNEGIPLVVVNDVRYHTPERRAVLDALTCVRLKLTIPEAGTRLLANTERYLKSPPEMYRVFRDFPDAVSRTEEIAHQIQQFSLEQLTYEYPEIPAREEKSQLDELIFRVYEGARKRFPSGIPEQVERTIDEELSLIQELGYEKYFLTCHEIVLFAAGGASFVRAEALRRIRWCATALG